MKQRPLLFILTALLFASGAYSQTPPVVPDTTARVTPISMPEILPADSNRRTFPWRVRTELNLGLTQSLASNNWASTQSNSIIWLSDLLFSLDKQVARHWTLDNDLRLAYGQSHSYDAEKDQWSPPQKASDRIRFDTIFRRFGHIVDPYLAASAESQFIDRTYRRTLYLNPAELTESAGIAHYLFSQPLVRIVRSRVGFGVRERFVQRIDSINTNHAILKQVTDAGGEWVTDVELGSPFTRFSYLSKLILFEAVYNSRAAETDKRWKSLDVNWDNTFRVNVTRLVQVGLSWQTLYDQEVTKGIRFRENLTLSVSLHHVR